MFAALLLLTVLGLGGAGIVPAAREALTRTRSRARAQRRPAPTHARPRANGKGVVLDARALRKSFGSVVAADDVSLTLRAGEVCALIGPNGSGKTTVLRLLAGAIQPEAGSVTLDGIVLDSAPTRERVLHGLVRTLQTTSALEGLTALENTLVGAGLRRTRGGALRTLVSTPQARAEDAVVRAQALTALAEVGLEWSADLPVDALPATDQRLVAVAAAIATQPRAVLLDEPSAGSSVEDLARLRALFVRLRAAGIAVLLVEHNLRLVRAVSDRVVVMAGGSVIADGSPDEIASDEAVRAVYLGRGAL
jgi:ABC-type branched-subunit amino acid transport system ATPase component